MEKNEFITQDIVGFKIIRDDLFEGGTKRRAFRRLINSIPESELVYACDYFGYAQYAIALTAKDVGKSVTLFYCSPKQETDVFKKVTALSNVRHETVPDVFTQMEATTRAMEYAEEHGARYLPVGLDFPEFRIELEKVVKEANIQAPEIWVLGGSGNLGRALKRAYPNIPVNMINLGTADFNAEGIDKIYDAPEKWDEPAEVLPPYPSTPYLDGKVWRFVLKYAKPGAYIWNVA
jgi:hypothetical protein